MDNSFRKDKFGKSPRQRIAEREFTPEFLSDPENFTKLIHSLSDDIADKYYNTVLKMKRWIFLLAGVAILSMVTHLSMIVALIGLIAKMSN